MSNVLELEGGRGLVVDKGRHGPWMQTWSGLRFYPADPQKRDVEIIDIAHALGNISRYGGHCRFYSVAEHSVLVSRMVKPELALEGLMHDAVEAYVGDMVRPLKRVIGDGSPYFIIERGVRRAIAWQFRLAEEIPIDVQIADVQICGLEKKLLWPRSQAWDLPHPVPSLTIQCLPPREASMLFLKTYCDLAGDDYDGLLAVFNYLSLEDDKSFGACGV